MRLSVLAAAAAMFLIFASSRPLAASTNYFGGQDLFIEPIQAACCNCDPRASDMQCFAECNAMLPRCRPPAPRAPAQTTNRSLGGACCYWNRRAGLTKMIPIGTSCHMPYYDHVERQTYWVTGRVCR